MPPISIVARYRCDDGQRASSKSSQDRSSGTSTGDETDTVTFTPKKIRNNDQDSCS